MIRYADHAQYYEIFVICPDVSFLVAIFPIQIKRLFRTERRIQKLSDSIKLTIQRWVYSETRFSTSIRLNCES